MKPWTANHCWYCQFCLSYCSWYGLLHHVLGIILIFIVAFTESLCKSSECKQQRKLDQDFKRSFIAVILVKAVLVTLKYVIFH